MLDHLFLNEGGGHLLPFLWLHGEDHTVLAEEIEKIYESGARSLCIESRPHPDFAGPGWWKDVDFILEECRRRGMRMYVLDDAAFPTGYAAGAVADADQALHKQYLILRYIAYSRPASSSLVLPFARIWRNSLLCCGSGRPRKKDRLDRKYSRESHYA